MMQDGEFDVRQSSRETHGGERERERDQSVETDEKGGRRSEGEGTG